MGNTKKDIELDEFLSYQDNEPVLEGEIEAVIKHDLSSFRENSAAAAVIVCLVLWE